MQRRRLFERAVVLLATVALAGCAGPGWKLTWSDEFNGTTAGEAPDATKWSFDIGGGGWGNHQLEFDTDRTANASLDGQGNLAITARLELNKLGGKNQYSSARMITRGHLEQKFGRYEARIKMPTGRGLWPAFWLIGANCDQSPWPACGEIDVMEYRGQEPGLVHGSLHGPGYSAGAAITRPFSLPGGAAFDADFHLFAIEWTGDQIAFFVDGTLYNTIFASQVPGSRWVFDHPFFVVLNLAVGGDYVGPPDNSVNFPQSMLVDYVRVYERDP